MLIQCTKKLLDELQVKETSEIYEEPLFSWHAKLITVNRRKTVVLVNDKNRYTIILYGLKAKDFKKLDEIIINAIRETLQDECIKDEIIKEFINRSVEIVYTKTKNRSMIAKMNKSSDIIYYYADLLNKDFINQSAVNIKLGAYLVGDGKGNYIYPSEKLYEDIEELTGKSIFSCKSVQLKVTLGLENYEVWRKLIIPINITFEELHRLLQTAFGWQDYHLHEFYIFENNKSVVNLVCDDEAFSYPTDVPMRLEKGIKISEYIPNYKRIKYNYDFGDDWQHYIEVEKIIDDYQKNFPECIEGKGNTPPEDVGGEYGYEEFLEIISNINNPEYESMVEWSQMQGYKDFDIDMINRRLRMALINKYGIIND